MKTISIKRLLTSILLGSLIAATAFYGCTDNPGVAPTDGKQQLDDPSFSKIRPLLPPNPSFGIFETTTLGDNVDSILAYGPEEAGFKGIFLYAYENTYHQFLDAAVSEGYVYRVARLVRSEIANNNWTVVRNRVDYCSSYGANVFWVDDGLSGGDGYNITKAQIDSVASIVHGHTGKLLATAEWDKTTVISNKSWFTNVDIVMPYEYDYTASQLNGFLAAVRDSLSGKSIIAFLGYNVAEGSQDPQLHDYIEVARNYNSYIFYYTEGCASLGPLVYYLKTNYGM
jgi:hypothetical protein